MAMHKIEKHTKSRHTIKIKNRTDRSICAKMDPLNYAAKIMQCHFLQNFTFVTDSITNKNSQGFRPPFEKWTRFEVVQNLKVPWTLF